MHTALKFVIFLALCGIVGGWYFYSRDAASGTHAAEAGGGSGAPGTKPSSTVPAIPVAVAHVRERPIPIYLDGLGTVQAFQNVTVRSQVEGRIDWGDFVEGSDVVKGQKIAQIDSRTYQANYDQAAAKKVQDQAKQAQDQARVSQDQAKKLQDEALQKQVEARKSQDEALINQAKAKREQDAENAANGRLNLQRFVESVAAGAATEQNVTDQRSQVKQLESAIAADEAAIQAANAAVLGDIVGVQAARAAVQGDEAAIQADEALVAGDAAMVKSDEAMVDYAKTILSYSTITAPFDGRTGVRLLDSGALLRTNETTGVIVLTQLQPISVIFTLPQQYLQSINEHSAAAKLKVLAVESDGKTVIDTGELMLVDNQIDSTTGTMKLKAKFQNEKRKLWPGGFVNVRLLLETREKAVVVSAPAVQQGPNGTFVFIIKDDQTVEMRMVKVWLIQDGKAIIDEGVKNGDLVVRTGQDRLKNGSKVVPDKVESDSPKANGAASAEKPEKPLPLPLPVPLPVPVPVTPQKTAEPQK